MSVDPLCVAESAARAAGAVLTRYFQQEVAMRTKTEKAFNLVSDADVEAEHAIVSVIREAFPNHEILGEEAHRGDPSAERVWVIDPLDGTTNFAHGIPQFAASIAYFEGGSPVCSVVYNPVREEWYTARRGEGARFNGKPATVSENTRLDQALIGIGFYYDRGDQVDGTLAAVGELLRSSIHCVRRYGCASLDLVMTGLGQLDAYFEFALEPWDFAGGWLFVEEAGGRVTDCRGGGLGIRKSSVLASNGRLHPIVQGIVEPHYPVR